MTESLGRPEPVISLTESFSGDPTGEIRALVNTVFERGKYSTQKTGRISSPYDGLSIDDIAIQFSFSTAPEDPPYAMSKNTVERVRYTATTDLVTMDHHGVFRQYDTTEVNHLYGLTDPSSETYGKLSATTAKAEDGLTAQDAFGVNIMTDEAVLAYLRKTQAEVDADWTIPEESAGDVQPTPATKELFKTIVADAADRRHVHWQTWDNETFKYKVQYDTSTGIHVERSQSYPVIIPLRNNTEYTTTESRVDSWLFPRYFGDPQYFRQMSIPEGELTDSDVPPEVYDYADALPYDLPDDSHEYDAVLQQYAPDLLRNDGLQDAFEDDIEKARTILQDRAVLLERMDTSEQAEELDSEDFTGQQASDVDDTYEPASDHEDQDDDHDER